MPLARANLLSITVTFSRLNSDVEWKLGVNTKHTFIVTHCSFLDFVLVSTVCNHDLPKMHCFSNKMTPC